MRSGDQRNPATTIRLHGVLLVAQGMTCPEVAKLLGDAPRTAEYWVRGFEEEGLAGLREGERGGRPRRLSEKQLQQVNAHHARLHRQWREERAAEFVLDYLPPYSPELNPIERVWKLTRRLGLHNRYFPLLQPVTTTVETEFASWAGPNETLRRLCAIT